MPKNLNMPVIPLPMTDRRNEVPSGKIVNDLQNIKITLVNHTKFKQLLDYIPGFTEMTWTDFPSEREFSYHERLQCVMNLFQRKTLPTALETVRLDFLIEGINIQDVTHLIRHRTFSFSSACTGDRDQRCHNITMPEAIFNSPGFNVRYERLMKECIQLYADMVDSDEISMMDARLCLPKAHDTSYYASCSLKDLLGFLNQRKDEQIQPSSDVIMALYMYRELCKAYPIGCFNLVDFESPDWFYINSAQTAHSTRLYAPYPKNDKFEWNPGSFIYGDRLKHEVSGTCNAPDLRVFAELKAVTMERIKYMTEKSIEFWTNEGFEIGGTK